MNEWGSGLIMIGITYRRRGRGFVEKGGYIPDSREQIVEAAVLRRLSDVLDTAYDKSIRHDRSDSWVVWFGHGEDFQIRVQ